MENIKTYITTESWVKGTKNGNFIEPFIPKNSGIVVISEKNGKVRFYHQGHSVCNMDIETFNKIPKIEKEFTDEYINDFIIPSEEIKILKSLFKRLRKEYSKDKFMLKVLRTLDTWIFLTKGSSAIKGHQYETLSFDNLPWVMNNGFSAKPYDFNENRSGRTTVAPTESEIESWINNPYDVLPIGIKEDEHCSYSEIFKIGKKLFQEMCGVEGIDNKFKDIVSDFLPKIDKKYEHYDYMTNKRIVLNMFENNTHHGKKKGLEFCHKNSGKTTADGITIGFSESNRKQSGNSIEEMAINGHNALLIQMGKLPITLEEYKMKILMDTI
jgi:hypothetical protein